jgi:anti-sigma regulatory factor (Ser/Thr protein kinase)
MTESELTVEGRMENLPGILEFIAGMLRKHLVDDINAYEIRLAVDEAVTNIITHAYKSTGGNIHIACARENEMIVITIEDEGSPFDPTKYPPPDLSTDLEHREIGGLGIYFIGKVMDTVTYRREGGSNVLMMMKRII